MRELNPTPDLMAGLMGFVSPVGEPVRHAIRLVADPAEPAPATQSSQLLPTSSAETAVQHCYANPSQPQRIGSAAACTRASTAAGAVLGSTVKPHGATMRGHE